MKKLLLFFVLSILFISFIAFFYQIYIQQKDYFNLKEQENLKETEIITEVVEIPSKYINYSEEEYDKAILEKRILVLFFTSNWCTKCSEQDRLNSEVFDSLNKEGVVGLKIHILDSETTTQTDALARKFDVIKENTFVILDKKGAVYFKNIGVLNTDELKSIFMKAGDI
ncbi:MAG: thioredoxin domain-containing protein [Patescibacteria group bacterium]